MRKFLVMQTDFTRHSGAVSVMHGVAYQVDPELVVDDINHNVTKWSPYAASVSLDYTLPYWPAGTVYVSVIDPGVGTDRRACVAKTKNGYYIVTPDNGALTHVAAHFGIEAVRVIDETVNRYPAPDRIDIFHGRDLFAYCGAKLAAGKISFEEVGPEYPVEEIVLLDLPEPRVEDGALVGYIASANTNFGINSSNIPVSMLSEIGLRLGDRAHLVITHKGKTYFDEDLNYEKSFGYVAPGAPLLYDSEGLLVGFALNLENFVERYGTETGPDWQVVIRKA